MGTDSNISNVSGSAASLQLAAAITPLYSANKPTSLDVKNAAPMVGSASIRTTAIAQRLKNPASHEARDYALATRHQAVMALVQFMQQLAAEDGGIASGLFAGIRVYGLVRNDVRDPFLTGEPTTTDNYRNLATIAASPALQAALLLSPPAPDEAEYFSQATDITDNTVALLRQFEANAAKYRTALNRSESALDELRQTEAAAAGRLAAADDRVAEARHDVSVARALFAEEAARIDAVNARRARVLAEEVKFLAYMRPREADNLIDTKTHAVDPGLFESPLPACLRQDVEMPDELADMLRVLREAPAAWFVKASSLLTQLDKIDHLTRLVQSACMRATAGVAVPRLATPAPGGTALTDTVARIAARQAEAIAPRLTALQNVNVASFADVTWQAVRDKSEQVVSLADVAEGGHGRPTVARAAAVELENLGRVVACLYAEFSGAPASLRLHWAETLSEFDEAPNLRNLANLPRWTEIEYLERRRLQSYADWLFSQVRGTEALATALVNDVVRMCLLLACHAPVDRIVSGCMARPIIGAAVGLRIPLLVQEPARVRIGMHALLYRGADLIGRAVVADIGPQEISAQLIQTAGDKVELGTDVRVHFDNAAAVSLKNDTVAGSLFSS
jgi:hypothetical protein